MSLSIVINIILGILAAYLALSVLWPFVLSVFGRFNVNWNKNINKLITNNILVLIPAYKEDTVIIETAKKCHYTKL